MPLPAYGVLIGTLSHFTREDPTSTTAYSHGKLYVDTPAGQYEGAGGRLDAKLAPRFSIA